MPAYYEIKFSPERRVEKFAGSRGIYYEFEDGSRLDVETTPVWCRRCRKITDGEQIRSVAEIDQKLADLDDPISDLYRFTQRSHAPDKEQFRLDLVQKELKRRGWRAGRRSPPKCICCGSTDIFVFPLSEACVHPGGIGMAEVRIVGMCSSRCDDRFFTPEGDLPNDS